MDLTRLGWNEEFEREWTGREEGDLTPARVAREDRRLYRVWCEAGEVAAEVSGRFRNEAAGREDFPAVGDWVAIRAPEAAGRAVIHGVLPRRSRFLRKVAGETTEAQVVAANVETVFLVSGLDDDFNLRRIERYVTLAWESGATPVVILNKTDLAEDVDLAVRQVEGIAFGVPIETMSARDGSGLDGFLSHLGPGKTGALLGSSGTGKSTLVNRLLGEERFETGETRVSDGRGRHTTTRRQLILLPDDRGCLIDTPGMRELQLWGDGTGLENGFAEIARLAEDCRFRDCSHAGEPGCAVQRALADGTLDVGRFESFLDQQRELAWLSRKTDDRARREEEARWRRVAIFARKLKKARDGMNG